MLQLPSLTLELITWMKKKYNGNNFELIQEKNNYRNLCLSRIVDGSREENVSKPPNVTNRSMLRMSNDDTAQTIADDDDNDDANNDVGNAHTIVMVRILLS